MRSRDQCDGRAYLFSALCLALLSGCQASLSDDEALSKELSVSHAEIDFGKLKIGEVAIRAIDVRNLGSRTLHLLEPERDCGCTRASLAARELAPGEQTTLEVELKAPLAPATVTKHVSIACGELPRAKRTVVLRADVAASLWAEPGIVRLDIPRGGMASTLVTLRHVPRMKITRVESDAPEVHVETARDGDDAREVTLRIDDAGLRPQQILDAHLAVFVGSETTPICACLSAGSFGRNCDSCLKPSRCCPAVVNCSAR
jgi:hypothetical protein